ncbi:MAG: DUF1285 domain-containing protein [Rhodospirillales bacterium]|nr:DUF1285 domain-containing protein [Rhodospirillales bacterium]
MIKHTPTAAAAVSFDGEVRFIAAPPPAAAGRTLIEDLGIHIDRHGRWFYHGSPIERKELVCLFASALTRDQAGAYWLVTPSEMGRIGVEDAPFLAVELFVSGSGAAQRLSLRTNVDEIIEVDAGHPLVIVTDPDSGEPSPYVQLDRGLSARLSRPVYYELVALAVAGERRGDHVAIGVWSAGHWFSLGEVEC